MRSGKVKIFLFIIFFLLAMFIRNALFGSIVLIGMGIIAPVFILPELLLLPIVDYSMIAVNGVTINKVVISFYILYFLTYLIKNKYFKSINRIIYVVLFFLIVLIGIINVSFDSSVISYAGGMKEILITNFLINLPRLFLFFLMYYYYKAKGYRFTKNSIEIIKAIIPYIMLGILIYTIVFQHVTYWRNIVARQSFEGSDPNEFSILIVSLSPYVFLNIYGSKNILFKVINIIGLSAIFYIVVASGSRAGFITFIFALILVAYFNKWIKISLRNIGFLIASLLSIIVIINSRFVNFNNLLLRFILEDSGLSSTTGKRSDFWGNAIHLFPQRPIIGYGLSTYTSRYYNMLGTGIDAVMHNIFFQTLIQLGLLGVVVLFLAIKKPFSNKYIFKQKDKTLLLPFLALLILLFGGMSLSWLWREVIWINLAICYVLADQIKPNENT